MSAQVTMYTTPTCGFCHMLKAYLKDKKVDFTEKDLTKDGDAYNTVLNKTGQLAVPVLEVGDKFVIGFDRNRIDHLLEENKLGS